MRTVRRAGSRLDPIFMFDLVNIARLPVCVGCSRRLARDVELTVEGGPDRRTDVQWRQ